MFQMRRFIGRGERARRTPTAAALAVVSALLALPPTGPVRADTYADDFGSGINAGWWQVRSKPLFTVDDTQGDVRLSKPAGGPGGVYGAGLSLHYQVEGDFDVSVDYSDASISRGSGSPGNQVQLNINLGNQVFCVVRSDEFSYGDNYHVWLDPPQTWAGARSTSDLAARFRVKRVGATVTGYADSTLIYQGTYNTDPARIAFVLQNNGTTDAVSVTFDNFSLVADRILLYPGDANVDRIVDYIDLGILATHYDESGPQVGWEDGDFDRNNAVDYVDLGILATNYGTGPAPAPVPEPAALSALAAASLVILRRRRRAAPRPRRLPSPGA